RHGAVRYFDAAGRPLDPRHVDLTDQGRAQAAAVGELLRPAPLDRAVCSGLPRTRQTMNLALAGRDIPATDDDRFLEIRAGRFRDVPPGRAPRAIGRAYAGAHAPGARFIGGDAFTDFADRVLEGWDALVAGDDWTHLLLVAHDAVHRVILGHALGAGLKAMDSLELDMGGLSILDLDPDGRCLLRAFNLTPLDWAKGEARATGMESVLGAYKPEK
ncbi:MAG: histidine phosphatase family protein, partial [Rhodobacterales bacterium]|nr:histidine phosphatase family protein [Rhodobacterales bacterium]